MAIYQYNIELIPRQSIIEEFRLIPNEIIITDESIINLWWRERKLPYYKIETNIYSFSKQIEWSKNSNDLKQFGDNESNDISIELTKDSIIERFSCRFDLRELNRQYINNIFNLAIQLDCLIADIKGNLFEPTMSNLLDNIKLSNSLLFVTNPNEFFNQLTSGQIKPE